MRVRARWLPIAAAIGAGAAVLPGLASGSSAPSSASFQAYDWGWMANGNVKATRVTVARGATVSFSYPTGRSEHNADFGRGPHPTSCAQLGGPGSGRVPPLPHVASGAGWSGNCTFGSPGIYRFHCDVHTFMIGTIVVQGAPGSPLAGRPSRAISIRSRQRGAVVHGTVRLSAPATGGRLEIDLSATARSLGRRGGRPVPVGRLSKAGLKPGSMRFAVALDAAAKRALRSAGRLPVTVKVIVQPPGRRSTSSIRRAVMMP